MSVTYEQFTDALTKRGWNDAGRDCWMSPEIPDSSSLDRQTLTIIRWCNKSIWTAETEKQVKQSAVDILSALNYFDRKQGTLDL